MKELFEFEIKVGDIVKYQSISSYGKKVIEIGEIVNICNHPNSVRPIRIRNKKVGHRCITISRNKIIFLDQL